MTDWPGRLAVRPWTPSDDEAVAHWRYSGRWSIYDQNEGNHMAGDDVAEAAGYRAIVAADDGTPVFVGDGHGSAFLRTVLDDVVRELPGKPIRALIQSWNTRSLSLARRFGFVEAGIHRCAQDGDEVDYTMVIRPVSA